VNETPQGDVTRLLTSMAAGDAAAEDRLIRLLYRELQMMAAKRLGTSFSNEMLSPTALVHEAFIRVFRQNHGVPLQNRKHLYFAFAQAIWRIAVEQSRRTLRRRACDARFGWTLSRSGTDAAVVEFDDALSCLRTTFPREFQITILRKSLGFSAHEIAEVLDVSPTTVLRGWNVARAFLGRHLQRSQTS